MQTKKCLQCEKMFEKKSSISQKEWESKTQFCSKKCWYQWKSQNVIPWNIGLTKESDPRIANMALAIKQTFDNGRNTWSKGIKGKNHPMYGRKLSEEVKQKMSNSHIGEKHWNWQGGKTDPIHLLRNKVRYQQWRLAVLERDNGECIICKSKERLNAHHMENFRDNKELRYDVNNGQTLCNVCHSRYHTKKRYSN